MAVPTDLFDLRSERLVQDPWPIYRTLRTHEPIHKSAFGYLVLTRHAEIVQAMNDPRFSSEPSLFAHVHRRHADSSLAAAVANRIIPFMDPPRHTQKRTVIAQAYSDHLKMAPLQIHERASTLMQQWCLPGTIDLITDYSSRFSALIMADIMGLPHADLDLLQQWGKTFFLILNPIADPSVLARVNQELEEFRTYIIHQASTETATGTRQGLLHTLLRMAKESDQISTDEVIDNAILLYADGVANSDAGLANVILEIFSRPCVVEAIRSNPSLVEIAVEEALRINPAVQYIAKVAKESLEFHGHRIRKHEAILLVLASANRDETSYPDPDAFSLNRSNRNHLTFGRGRHSCIGSALVRQEMLATVQGLLDVSSSVTLSSEPLAWEMRLGHRWLEGLRLDIWPATT
jgi:cytochrome P450